MQCLALQCLALLAQQNISQRAQQQVDDHQGAVKEQYGIFNLLLMLVLPGKVAYNARTSRALQHQQPQVQQGTMPLPRACEGALLVHACTHAADQHRVMTPTVTNIPNITRIGSLTHPQRSQRGSRGPTTKYNSAGNFHQI
jgi:hypothetical protein